MTLIGDTKRLSPDYMSDLVHKLQMHPRKAHLFLYRAVFDITAYYFVQC